MKILNVILLVVGICSGSMYGHTDDLERFDYGYLENMSCEELRQRQKKLIEDMIHGSLEERNRIFSLRQNNEDNLIPTTPRVPRKVTCISCFKQLFKFRNKVYIDPESN